jgi:hypothetical protein
MTSPGAPVRADENRENAHGLRTGIGAEMRHAHRLHQGVALMICALAAVAVIYSDLAFEDIGKKRHAVPVQSGLRAWRQCDDCGGHMCRSVRWIVQRLADDGGAGRQQRHGRHDVFLRSCAVERREKCEEQQGCDVV